MSKRVSKSDDVDTATSIRPSSPTFWWIHVPMVLLQLIVDHLHMQDMVHLLRLNKFCKLHMIQLSLPRTLVRIYNAEPIHATCSPSKWRVRKQTIYMNVDTGIVPIEGSRTVDVIDEYENDAKLPKRLFLAHQPLTHYLHRSLQILDIHCGNEEAITISWRDIVVSRNHRTLHTARISGNVRWVHWQHSAEMKVLQTLQLPVCKPAVVRTMDLSHVPRTLTNVHLHNFHSDPDGVAMMDLLYRHPLRELAVHNSDDVVHSFNLFALFQKAPSSLETLKVGHAIYRPLSAPSSAARTELPKFPHLVTLHVGVMFSPMHMHDLMARMKLDATPLQNISAMHDEVDQWRHFPKTLTCVDGPWFSVHVLESMCSKAAIEWPYLRSLCVLCDDIYIQKPLCALPLSLITLRIVYRMTQVCAHHVTPMLSLRNLRQLTVGFESKRPMACYGILADALNNMPWMTHLIIRTIDTDFTEEAQQNADGDDNTQQQREYKSGNDHVHNKGILMIPSFHHLDHLAVVSGIFRPSSVIHIMKCAALTALDLSKCAMRVSMDVHCPVKILYTNERMMNRGTLLPSLLPTVMERLKTIYIRTTSYYYYTRSCSAPRLIMKMVHCLANLYPRLSRIEDMENGHVLWEQSRI